MLFDMTKDKPSPTKAMKDAGIAGFKAELDFWIRLLEQDKNFRHIFEHPVPFLGYIAAIEQVSYRDSTTFAAYTRGSVGVEEMCHFIEDYVIDDFGEELTLEEAYDSIMNLVKDKVAAL